MIQSEQEIAKGFTVANPATGAAADADSLPVGTLLINGEADEAEVQVWNEATGRYAFYVELPELEPGELAEVEIRATVGGVEGVGIVWSERVFDPDMLSADIDIDEVAVAVAQRLAAALEQGALAVQSALVDGVLHVYRGDTLSVIFTGLGDLTGRTALYVMAKWSADDADGEAVLEVSEAGGLLRLNGGEATAGWGSLTVNDAAEGVVTLSLAAEATAMLAPNTYFYDVQMVTAEGVRTAGAGTVIVTADIKRAVS